MIDRDAFFEKARVRPFSGSMTPGQVTGCNFILDAWEASSLPDIRWLAYMLATTKWETAHTMHPVEEYGHGAGHPYGAPDPVTGQTYYGRGYVQLTWKANYEKMGKLLDLDLVHDPAQALNPDIAARIMFKGMEGGLFTGVGLPRYFNDHADDPINARRIINGTDHAADIANIHNAFLAALT